MSPLCRLTLAVAVALALATPTAADARSAPVPVSGAFTVNVPSREPVFQPLPGDRCLITLTTAFEFTGTLQGEFTAPFDITHNAACDQPAQDAFVARGTFSGSVAGRQGSFDFVFRGTIDAANNAQGTLIITGASGDLAGLHGAVRLSGVSGLGGTYRGVLAVCR